MGEVVQSQQTATPEGGEDHAGEVVQWEDLSGPADLGADDEGLEAVVVAPAEGTEEPPKAATPVEEPIKTVTEEPAPEAVEAKAQPQGLTPEQLSALADLLNKQKEQPVTKTPEQIAAEQAEFARAESERNAKVQEDLEKQYQVAEEDVPLLIAEPEKALPKLAAKLHMQVMQNVRNEVQQMMQQSVPAIVQNQQVMAAKNLEAKNAFYKVNADLVEHEATVLQVGAMYRQMNPQATPEKSIKDIGDLVRVSLGLPIPSQAPASQTQSAPIRPAGVGSPPAQRTQARPAVAEGQTNWGELIDDED